MTVENIAFSQNTLSCIIRALTDLQRYGGSANDDLWLLGKSHANATKLPYVYDFLRQLQSIDWNTKRASDTVLRPELLDALTTMKYIEEMKLMFHELARSCERKLRSLKKEVRPSFMHCGIQILPDEMLRRVFDLLVHDNKVASPTGPEVTLSHVSSRFRSVCLNTRSLWTRLDTRMSKSWIEAYLERSRGSPLTVVVHEPLSESEESYKLISSCAPRWRSLQVGKPVGRSLLLHASEVGSEHLGKLRLPELKYLTIDRKVGHEYDENIEIMGKWDMPKLSHVFLDNIWFFSKNKYVGSENIRSFNFRSLISRLDRRSVADNSELLSVVLGSSPNLSELQLDIEVQGSGGTCNDVTLPKVEYFSLKIKPRGEADLSMVHLNMPRLVKFKLEIDADNSNDENERRAGGALSGPDWVGTWEDMVPSGQRNSVTDFTLLYDVYDPRTQEFEMGPVFRLFPALQTLVLANWYHPILLLPKDSAMPPLHTLSVQYTPFDFLAAFVLAMQRSGRWDGFEFLRMEYSWLLSKQDVEDVINKKRRYNSLVNDY